MSHFRSPRRVFVAALAGSLAIGLSCEQLDVTAVDVDSVTVTPDPASVEIGKTVQLEAVLEDAAGNRLTRPLQWSSESPSVATVDGNGRVTGVTAGTARIVAASGGRSGDAMVTVTQNTVETVDVTPETAALAPGETQQLTAVARDADGLAIPGRTATWLSENPGVATVNASGVVTAVTVGTATIRATIDGVVGTALIAVQQKAVASVTVTPPNASVLRNNTVQLTAVARAADNSILLGRPVTWISDAPAIATVNGNGLVTGVAIGTAPIRAVIDGVTGSATIQVESRPVASVTVQPAAAAVIEGNTVQLTAELKAQDGTVLAGRTVTWSSSAAAIATVNANGLVTGVQVGQATITATAEGVSGTAVVNVQAKPVQTVTVTPTSVSLMVGDTVRIGAELRAADGSLITNRKPVWSSSDDAIATVDTDGLVAAVARGNVTITATAEGKQGTSSVSVTDPVATVTLAPDSAKLIQGDTLTFVATTRASDGTVITGRVIAWSSLNPAVASIDPATGKVTAVAVGTTQIIATVEGKADSAKVTVDPKPVTSVTIQPTNPSVILGGTLQLNGELKAADGTVLSGRPVQWTSSDQTVATVTNTGLVSGLKVGSTTIRLTSTNEGVFGEVVLQVVDQPVASVVVTPSTANMFVGDTLRLNAATLAADGVTDLERTVTWSIEASTGDASISATGLVTALAPGTVRAIATAEGKSDDAIITISLKPVASVKVVPNPGSVEEDKTLQMSDTLKAVDGTVLLGRTVTWSVVPGTGTASINPTTGLVTGLTAGQVTVTATSETTPGSGVPVSGSATVTVTPKPVATVIVAPNPGTVEEGKTLPMSDTLKAVNGSVITGRLVTWSVVPGTGTASFDPSTETLTGLTAGTVTVTATVPVTPGSGGTVSGSATVTVTPKPVATVIVASNPTTIEEGETLQMTDTLKATDGTLITGRSGVTWSVTSVTGTASINPSSGLLTGLTAGTVTITATIPVTPGSPTTVSGSTTVTVTPKSVATVIVAPNSGTVEVGKTLPMSDTLKAADGSVITGRSVSWSVSAGTGNADIDASTGVLTGVSPGTVMVTATIPVIPGSSTIVSGSATVIVTPPPPAPIDSIDVMPDALTMFKDSVQKLDARAFDANGTELFGRTIAWTPSNGKATVDANGNVTAVDTGVVVIRAQADAGMDSATITIQHIPVDSVTVAADGTSPTPGGPPVALTATVWAGGAPVFDRTVTWSGGTPGIATIDPVTGVVTIDPLATPGQQAQFVATADGVASTPFVITVQ